MRRNYLTNESEVSLMSGIIIRANRLLYWITNADVGYLIEEFDRGGSPIDQYYSLDLSEFSARKKREIITALHNK